MKSRKKMVRVSGLLRRVPEAVWYNPKGPSKKKTPEQKRAERTAFKLALINLHRERREGIGEDTYPTRPRKLRAKTVVTRAPYVETNLRYPLREMQAARTEGRKPRPQTKAYHW